MTIPEVVDRIIARNYVLAGVSTLCRSLAAIAFIAVAAAGTAADARVHHHGSGTASGSTSVPNAVTGSSGGASSGSSSTTSGNRASHSDASADKSVDPGRHDEHVDIPPTPAAHDHSGPSGDHARDGDTGSAGRELHRGPSTVAPTDVDRIDGAMFSNGGRSFKRIDIFQLKNGPVKTVVPGSIAVGRPAGHPLRRQFSNLWGSGGGRNAIGIANETEPGEGVGGHDAHEPLNGAVEGANAIGVKVDGRLDPRAYKSLHLTIQGAVKVEPGTAGATTGINGTSIGHSLTTPAAIGGPARNNVASVGGTVVRPKH